MTRIVFRRFLALFPPRAHERVPLSFAVYLIPLQLEERQVRRFFLVGFVGGSVHVSRQIRCSLSRENFHLKVERCLIQVLVLPRFCKRIDFKCESF